MSKHAWGFSLFVSIVALGPCATVPGCQAARELRKSSTGEPGTSGPPSIPDPNQRFQFSGFSVLPPTGKDWTIASGPSAFEVTFAKKLEDQRRAVLATAWGRRVTTASTDRRELLEGMIRAREEGGKAGHIRLVAFASAFDSSPGSECARYDRTVQDRGVSEFPDALFIIASHGLLCTHPSDPAYVIGVEYSQRVAEGETLLPIEAEGEPFLQSLIFTPR